MKSEEAPAFVIDTREPEHTRYRFIGSPTVVKMLDAGDYSLAGFENRVAVERKEMSDAYSCVGSNRARFVRCLDRLSRLDRAAIVIEASIEEFSKPPARTVISSQQAINSYIAWSCTYRIPVLWMPNRAWAERATLKFLTSYLKHCLGERNG